MYKELLKLLVAISCFGFSFSRLNSVSSNFDPSSDSPSWAYFESWTVSFVCFLILLWMSPIIRSKTTIIIRRTRNAMKADLNHLLKSAQEDESSCIYSTYWKLISQQNLCFTITAHTNVVESLSLSERNTSSNVLRMHIYLGTISHLQEFPAYLKAASFHVMTNFIQIYTMNGRYGHCSFLSHYHFQKTDKKIDF